VKSVSGLLLWVLAASNYTYAEATLHRDLPNGSARMCALRSWVRAGNRRPDKLKNRVTACRYEPELNQPIRNGRTTESIIPARQPNKRQGLRFQTAPHRLCDGESRLLGRRRSVAFENRALSNNSIDNTGNCVLVFRNRPFLAHRFEWFVTPCCRSSLSVSRPLAHSRL